MTDPGNLGQPREDGRHGLILWANGAAGRQSSPTESHQAPIWPTRQRKVACR